MSLTEAPSWLNELVPLDGRWYVVYPPMPAALLVPIVALFGTGVAQQVVAMVEELPEGFAAGGDARARPVARLTRGAEDRLLDLLGGRRGVGAVVDPHVHGAVTLGPEAGHDGKAMVAEGISQHQTTI